MNIRFLACTAILLSCAPHALRAEPQQKGAAVSAALAPLPPLADQKSIALTRIVSNIAVGEKVGTYGAGFGSLCVPAEVFAWGQGPLAKTGDFEPGFARSMREGGFKVESSRENLFEEQAPATDYSVGARILDTKITVCATALTLSIKTTMSLEWQVYSNFDRKVVATLMTTAAADKNGRVQPADAMLAVFDENVRKLQALPEFRTLAAGGPKSVADASAPSAEGAPILISAAPLQAALGDATGSVVAILSGGGHGSGFLISPEGYLLTNQHVVGEAKIVKVRWSDGFETTGEVVRSNKRRDVALIKTDARGRAALNLRPETIQPGENVIAVGTPIDPAYQNTVTKGVASGNRIIDGFSFLQSDVAINPGNSGGPLLDEQSRVVAIAVLKDTRGGDLNFFIPVRDAMDFLSLKIQ